MARSAKLNKLRDEYESLLKLEARSRGKIKIEPAIVQPGRPPESYVVTYKCRGIEAVNDDQSPIYRDEHQVSIYLPHGYPLGAPEVNCLTPIWHPNIKHLPPRHVCVNAVDTWWPGRHLDDLVMWVGDLVQYKRYHAEWVEPFPEDEMVAKWVREYGEPKGYVGPGKPVDETPLTAQWTIKHDWRRIKLGEPSVRKDAPADAAGRPHQPQLSAEPPAAGEGSDKGRPWRIKLGERLNNKG